MFYDHFSARSLLAKPGRSSGQEHLRRVYPDSDQTIRGEEANWEDWLKTLSRDESLAVYARRFRRPSDSDVELEEDLLNFNCNMV